MIIVLYLLYGIAALAFLTPFLFWSMINFSHSFAALFHQKWRTVGIVFLISSIVVIICILAIILMVIFI